MERTYTETCEIRGLHRWWGIQSGGRVRDTKGEKIWGGHDGGAMLTQSWLLYRSRLRLWGSVRFTIWTNHVQYIHFGREGVAGDAISECGDVLYA